MKKARILLALLAIIGIVGGAAASKFNAANIYTASTYGSTVLPAGTVVTMTTTGPRAGLFTAFYTTILGASITNSVSAGFIPKAE